MSRPLDDVPGQTRVLFHAFLARFFEHESTAGRTDLRESFFWLIGALGAPGMLFAFYRQFHWHFLAMSPVGAERLRVGALFDKTLYLTLTCVVIGLVSVAVWSALIVDRRDALILGVLPLRRRSIVAAKLLSLAAYVGILTLGMHAGAAVLFGTFLGSTQGWTTIARGIVAHLVAASATGMFVFLSVVALQSVCLTVVGPRRFARTAAILQLLLIAAIAVTLLMTPTLSGGASSLVAAAAPVWWLTYTPPIWFLGLYETLAGPTSEPLHELSQTGLLALGGAALIVALFYPVACWRVLATAISAGGPATSPWNRLLSSRIIDLLAADASTRGALQFVMATAGRVGRFRLVLSAALGLSFAMIVPILLYWIARGGPEAPRVSLLSAPLLATTALVAGWRVVFAMPSELIAGWVFRAMPIHGFLGRAAARRLTFALGVLAPVALFACAWGALWGIATTCLLVVNSLIAGGILVEAHLWGFAGIPCTRSMAVSDSNLQGRWPFYGVGLLAYVLGIPAIEIWAADNGAGWLLTAGLAAAYGLMRSLSNDAARVNMLTDDHRGLIMLDLTVVRLASSAARPSLYVMTERHPPPEIPHA